MLGLDMTRRSNKRDKRDCPECQTRMELKGPVSADLLELWQCPLCKNVEFLYGDS